MAYLKGYKKNRGFGSFSGYHNTLWRTGQLKHPGALPQDPEVLKA
jgi:hypothetical protein